MNYLSCLTILICFAVMGLSPSFAQARRGPKATITLERTPCYGPCPVYKLTLRNDGTATYTGIAQVERVGTYRGKFKRQDFARLSKLLLSQKYFQMKDRYAIPVTDKARVITSFSLGKRLKTVENYGNSGPAGLRRIETAIESVAERVKWEPDSPPEQSDQLHNTSPDAPETPAPYEGRKDKG